MLVGLDVAAKSLAFVAAICVARQFGAAGFGMLGVAQAVAGVALIVATCGLESFAVRTAVAEPRRSLAVAADVIRLRLVLGAAALAGAVCIAALGGSDSRAVTLVFLYGLTVWTGALSLQWLAQSERATHVMGLAQLASQASYLLLVLWLVPTAPQRLELVPVALIAGELVGVAVLYSWVRRKIGPIRFTPAHSNWKPLLRGAAPLGLSQALRAGAFASDMILVGAMFSVTAAGAYGVAMRMFQVGVSAVSLYLLTGMPALIKTGLSNAAQLAARLHRSMATLVGVLALAALAVHFLGEPGIEAVFGLEFAAAGVLLSVLMLQLIAYGLVSHYRNALLVMERQSVDTALMALGLLLHVGCKIAFGLQFGLIGIAIGGAVAEATLLLACALAFRKLLGSRAGSATPVAPPRSLDAR